MDVKAWDYLRQHVDPGGTVETTLLGRVPWRINERGEYEGWIPSQVKAEADKNGFAVEVADLKRNAFTLRRLR